VGSIDLFVGENIEYAARLVEAGVPVELNVVPGAYHVFFAIKPGADVSKRFGASYSQALGRAFRPPAPAS
jgi:acetyl esterase/lipase